MTQVVKLKRSATPGKVPTTADLELGEIAINTYDGKLYFEKDSGTPTVVSVATSTDLVSKQDVLVSGTNIKTVNGSSLLGSGDLAIGGGSSIPISDEGVQITSGATSMNFTGSGVTAVAVGSAVTVNIPGGASNTLNIQNKTAAYTVVAGDIGTIINCTSGTFTVSLTAAATLGAGFNCWVWNTGATNNVITIDPSLSETIDGTTTLLLRGGEGIQIVCDGTNWQTGDKKAMRGYAENINVAQSRPNASGDLDVAIGAASKATGGAGIALGFDAQTSVSRGSSIGCNSGANGSRVATGSGAMALGGSYASGTDSFAAAVTNNTSTYGATGANSVAIGQQVKAQSANSIAIGALHTVSQTGAVALGYGNSVSRSYATAFGLYASSDTYGKLTLASGRFAATGDAQSGTFILRRATTDATATVLTADTGAALSTNQVILPNNSAYAFTGIIVARQQAAGGTQSAAWEVKGLIRREGTAATTVLVNSALTVIDNTPGWTLALSADTTNGGLAITATGAAATNIRWVATIQTSEVTYA